ncbi:MAG TPA: transcription antitermination factor NusB [Geminicoccaceae bacterium]
MAASARRIALDVLGRVLDRGRPFDDTFAGHPGLEGLEVRDRAFARLLITTVLRRRGQIDDLLARFVPRPPKSGRVRNILRLGLAQLLFLATPAHAATAETVALARGEERFARGLVNAVLRRAHREGPELVRAQDPARQNLPGWLFERWTGTYGEAVTRAIAFAQLEEPPLDLTAKGDPAALAERLDAIHLGGATIRRRGTGPVEALPGYAEGAFWVQDVAATLPARLLGDVGGAHVLDLCAAPGGKTAQLAAAGAAVTAVELAPKRAERLRSNLARLRLEAEVVVADALAWEPDRAAPLMLLDAPCTATGTIRRHPDIPWHKTPEDVARMADLQARLVAAASRMLAAGGTLLYASCSLEPEEGPELIERVLATTGLTRLPVREAELGGLPVELTPEGEVRTLPCHLGERGGMDGFFIARLRRPD